MTPFQGTNRVTSPYGGRTNPISGKWETHRGQDIVPTKYAGEAVPESAWNVRECTGGTVLRVSSDGSRGNYVDIQTAQGVFERYQHMKSIAVKVGQKVAQGQLVGIAGNTGSSTARHLHFGVYKNGTAEANAVTPQLWSDLPNLVGVYAGNDNLDKSASAPTATMYTLKIGPMSSGDKVTLAKLSESLGLPVEINEVK